MFKRGFATLIFLSATVGYSVGCGGTEKLTASAGETLRLSTGSSELHGEYSVYWFLKNDSGNHTLVHSEAGNLKQTRPNLELDRITGALTHGPLSVKDSGVYVGEITNGNNGVCTFTYEVSVSEPGTDPATVGSQSNTITHHRNHTAAAVSGCLFGVVVVTLACLLCVKPKRWKERKGNSQVAVV